MFHSINIFGMRKFLFLGALVLALAGCSGEGPTPTAVGVVPAPTPIPTPVVGKPVVSVPPPIAPGQEIGISVNVDSVPGIEIRYQWTHPEGQGEILDGQGSEGIIYRAPTQPGTYKIGVEVTAAGVVIERSEFVTVGEKPTDTSTLGPTGTPVTDTPTPGPSPPSDVPVITLSVARNIATASGQVSDLDPAQYPVYKVLVYLKTDIWYIQPVLGGFASIQEDGSWRMPELKIIDGVPTTAYAYLAREDFQAPDQSSLELQVDGVDIIARAEPVEVQLGAASTISVTLAPITPGAASITLSVARNIATASGQVSGLDPAQYPAYKVLVYLKTDIWYIQPVLGGFASIQEDGTWRMPELKIIDGVPTTAYAYLARRDFQVPDKTSLKLQVDGVDIIAGAEPVEVQ